MNAPRSAYVINLERRADRRSEMQKELLRIGWDAKFFTAIEPLSAAGFDSIGARGCFLSHLAVLKAAREARVNRLIILEDDVNFTRRFVEGWQSMIKELDALEWSICYPGHTLSNLPPGLSALSPESGVLCTHFILINHHAIDSIIEALESFLSRPAGDPRGGPMHIDGAYSTIRWQNPTLKTYAFFPVLGYQRPSRTDIRDARWFDRIGALQPVVDAVRKIKEAWRT
jgi:glycosyl transferase family 25